MAEWSKATDSSSVLLVEAWVRTPPDAQRSALLLPCGDPPTGRGLGLVGHDGCLTRSRSRVRSSEPVRAAATCGFCPRPCKRIGAAGARWAHNPKVRGSKPRFAIAGTKGNRARLCVRPEGLEPPAFGSGIRRAANCAMASLVWLGRDLNPRLRRDQGLNLTP